MKAKNISFADVLKNKAKTQEYTKPKPKLAELMYSF